MTDDEKLLAVEWDSEPDISHPRVEVDSTCVSHIGWDEEAMRLYVTFRQTNLTYTFRNCTSEQYEQFLHDPINGSHGQHFNRVIKPNLECEHSLRGG